MSEENKKESQDESYNAFTLWWKFLHQIQNISKQNYIISNLIGAILLVMGIIFLWYWILKYPNVIYSGLNPVYIFWLMFIWGFLLFIVNLYLTKVDNKDIAKIIDKEQEQEEEMILTEKEKFLSPLTDFLDEKDDLEKLLKNYSKGQQVRKVKWWKRFLEIIPRKDSIQIAIENDKKIKNDLDELFPWKVEEFKPYWIIKIKDTEINEKIEKFKIILNNLLEQWKK